MRDRNEPPHSLEYGNGQKQNSDFPEELCKRFEGFMEKLNERSGANAIHDWCRNGFLGFTRVDSKAFKLRDPAAHGSMNLFGIDDDTKDKAIAKVNRIHNMLNKIYLFAMGYSGRYFDYSDWKVSTFPPSSQVRGR